MTTESETSDTSRVPAGTAFAKGFMIRLLYGSFGVAMVLLIRPDLLGKNLDVLLGGGAAYLLICLAGGTLDAVKRTEREVTGSPRLRLRDALWFVLLVAVLFVLWRGR